jgi:hypothetical protein
MAGSTLPKLTRALAATALAACGASIAQASTPSPGARLAYKALTDAVKSGGLHAVEVRRLGNAVTNATEDVSNTEGTQTVSGTSGWKARILVVNHTAYLAGNAAGLRTYFGFPASVASKIGARWVSIQSSGPGYTEASYDATMASTIASITPNPGNLTETGPTKIGGIPAIGIRGTGPSLNRAGTPSSITLYVSTSGRPLPLRVVLSDTKGDSKTVVLSGFGEHFTVHAPHGAVPILSLA